MNCRDVRDVADSFLCDELAAATNHEILRHLDGCPACRAEIHGRCRLRDTLGAAFERAPDLQPRPEFLDRLRGELRDTAVRSSARTTSRWFAIAAGIAVVATLTGAVVLMRTLPPAGSLAQDAMGDHRNCALKFRLVRMPMALGEAARQFDATYRLLLDTPPGDFVAPGGPVRVIDRHSCVYGDRRFGHVVMEYRGSVVSLLLAASDESRPAATRDAVPRVIARSRNRLSVVSVGGSRHAIMLVSDLDSAELTELSKIVSLPLVDRLQKWQGPPGDDTPVALIHHCARRRAPLRG